MRSDVAIIGGGIVGLATAYQMQRRFPAFKVVVVEKESVIGRHQTSHNSGVLHSGIYYRPGSLRARNCRDGREAMVEFCDAEGIPFEICGKVIVAVDQSELTLLDTIYERGRANGVRCEVIDAGRLRELEPHAAGIRAIHVPDAGIVDFLEVARALARRVGDAGGEVKVNAEVLKIERRVDGLILGTTGGEIRTKYLVNCAGLYSDRVAALTGSPPPVRIVPFRGEYYSLIPGAEHLCRNLIYPVPDPGFPFLGVHFTKMVHGGVECGPNAVLAFARQGYSAWRVQPNDLFGTIAYRGFRRLAARNWRTGLDEVWRSLSKAAFVKALQRLIPVITSDQLVAAPAGVRAQAVDPEGQLVDDFLILESERVINVCNAPSPAATSSLNIGGYITDKLALQVA